jgi:hypothetical protein
MSIWNTLFHDVPVEAHSSSFATRLTNAMLSAAAASSGALTPQLSKLFQAHAASRALFTVMT